MGDGSIDSIPTTSANVAHMITSNYFAAGDRIKSIKVSELTEYEVPPFPLPSDYKKSNNAQPLQIEFRQRTSCHNSVKSDCQMVFDFVNYTRYSGHYQPK